MQVSVEWQEGLRVCKNGIALAPGRPIQLALGDLITVDHATAPPSVFDDLATMLQHPHGWDPDPPNLHSGPCSHFWVLTDGGPRGITVDFARVSRSHDFAEFVSNLLDYRPWHATIRTSQPRIRNGCFRGVDCKAVVLATETLPTVPIPPGRIVIMPRVVFLDLRPILQGFVWRTYNKGEIELESFEQDFLENLPEEGDVYVHGGVEEERDSRMILHFQDGEVLVVEYASRPRTVPVSDTDGSDGPSEGGPPPPDAEPDDHVTGSRRSRSPKGRRRGLRNRCAQHCGRGAFAASMPGAAAFPRTRAAARTSNSLPLKEGPFPFHLGVSIGAALLCLCVGLLVRQLVRCAISRKPKNAPKQTKLLGEPTSTSNRGATILTQLRDVTLRLGLGWPHFPYDWGDNLDALQQHQEDAAADRANSEMQISFVVLVPDYIPERILCTVGIPATLGEAEDCLQERRSTDKLIRHPFLQHVMPQSVRGHAVYVAAARWNTLSNIVCMNACEVDGRLFAIHAPIYASKAQLLQIADMPGAFNLLVFVGDDDLPLPEGVEVHLHEGAQIYFCFEGNTAPSGGYLPDLLQEEEYWQDASPYPEPQIDCAYCLARGGYHKLHVEDFSRPTHFRQHIAAVLGLGDVIFSVTPATPCLTDVAILGVPCRNVIAICDWPQDQGRGGNVVILDCRPASEGFRAISAVPRYICNRELHAALPVIAPGGWKVRATRDPEEEEPLRTHAGTVFTIDYVPRNTAEPTDTNEQAPVDVTQASQRASGGGTGAAPAYSETSEAFSEEGRSLEVHTSNLERAIGDDAEQVSTATFVVLSQDYTPEVCAVDITFPSTTLAAFAAISAARSASRRAHSPCLLPVDPQPEADFGIVIARPLWAADGVFVAVDSRAIDGRFFAVKAPGILRRDSLLTLTGLEQRPFLQVHVRDVPWPLTDAQTYHPEEGDLVVISWPDQHFAILHTLADRLLDPGGWDSPNLFFLNQAAAIWAFGDEGNSFILCGHDSDAELAHRVCGELRIRDVSPVCQFAAPQLADYAHKGQASANLLAVAQPSLWPDAYLERSCIYIAPRCRMGRSL